MKNLELSEMRRIAEREVLRYRENASFVRGWIDGGGNGDTARFRERQRWVWAVERVRESLRKTAPEKERFFAELYQLDHPHGRIRAAAVIRRISIEQYISISMLQRWRSEILFSVAIAAAQAQAFRPY